MNQHRRISRLADHSVAVSQAGRDRSREVEVWSGINGDDCPLESVSKNLFVKVRKFRTISEEENEQGLDMNIHFVVPFQCLRDLFQLLSFRAFLLCLEVTCRQSSTKLKEVGHTLRSEANSLPRFEGPCALRGTSPFENGNRGAGLVGFFKLESESELSSLFSSSFFSALIGSGEVDRGPGA